MVSSRRVNRSYGHTVFKPLMRALLLRCVEVAGMLLDAMALIARKTFFHKKGSKAKIALPKPHKPMTQKPC